jgi:G3E family GTPase
MNEINKIGPEGSRLPVVLITGFLGSGKTTLLSRILQHPDMGNTAVIVNEFGEIGLDHMLLETPTDEDEMVLLNSGCLCCTIRGDLVNTLQDLLLKRQKGEIPAFERVVVETTGLADPAPILLTILSDELISQWFILDSVVTVVDAFNGSGQLDTHFESVKQAVVADRIVLSKVDITDAATIKNIRARLLTLNPGADIREVSHGDVDPYTLLNIGIEASGDREADIRNWLREDAFEQEDCADHEHHDHDHKHNHSNHDAGIKSFAIFRDTPVQPDGLKLWLNMLAGFRGPQLLRVKGLLNVAGKPVVVHAVQHLFHDPVVLPKWPTEDRRSRIVFITHNLDRDNLERTLDALDLNAEGDKNTPSGAPFDPEAYKRFATAMAAFSGSDGKTPKKKTPPRNPGRRLSILFVESAAGVHTRDRTHLVHGAETTVHTALIMLIKRHACFTECLKVDIGNFSLAGLFNRHPGFLVVCSSLFRAFLCGFFSSGNNFLTQLIILPLDLTLLGGLFGHEKRFPLLVLFADQNQCRRKRNRHVGNIFRGVLIRFFLFRNRFQRCDQSVTVAGLCAICFQGLNNISLISRIDPKPLQIRRFCEFFVISSQIFEAAGHRSNNEEFGAACGALNLFAKSLFLL